MNENFSPKEIALFNAIGVSGLIGLLEPMAIYRAAIEKAFLEHHTGPAARSLRAVYNAYLTNNILRMTPEWDNLINL